MKQIEDENVENREDSFKVKNNLEKNLIRRQKNINERVSKGEKAKKAATLYEALKNLDYRLTDIGITVPDRRNI